MNIEDNNGRTAVHAAVSGRNFEAIKILIEYGANVNALDNEGNSVLKGLVDLWIEGDDIIVTLLVNSGLDINSINQKGFSVGTLAIKKKNYELVSALMVHKANFISKDKPDIDVIFYLFSNR